MAAAESASPARTAVLVPAVVEKKLVVTITLDDRATRAKELFQTMQASAHQMGMCAILLGLEFIEAKKALGETRGGDRKTAEQDEKRQTSTRWTFDSWLEHHFPKLSRTRAYDFIRVARESKAGLLKSGAEALTSLLALAPSQLNDEQRALLNKEVKGFAGERDLGQLMLDLGLTKKAKKGKGSASEESGPALYDPSEPEPGWDPAIWALLCDAQRKEDNQAVSAIELAHTLEMRLLEETGADTFAHLPPLALEALHAAVRAADDKLAEATAPKAKANGKGKAK